MHENTQPRKSTRKRLTRSHGANIDERKRFHTNEVPGIWDDIIVQWKLNKIYVWREAVVMEIVGISNK